MKIYLTNTLHTNGLISSSIRQWYVEYHQEMGGKIHPAVSRMLADGVVISFGETDFINKSTYKGFIKRYRCNSTVPKFHKMYCGKEVGMVHMVGFKIVDFDKTRHHILVSKMDFIKNVFIESMYSEFYSNPDKMEEMYLYENEDTKDSFVYNRHWEVILGLSPQEKIVLANLHGEEPFPHSYYENDRGMFSKRTQSDEYNIRLEGELASISDIRDYEANDTDDAFDIMDKTIMEREKSFQEGVRDGFDYGDFEDFSDIYTRTRTHIEDFELYPIRVNCTPKSIKKRGKSPYDRKLGLIEWRYFNNYQKPIDSWKDFLNENPDWKSPTSPKYNWEMNEDEKLADEYNLPDNFWEEIEMAYQQR